MFSTLGSDIRQALRVARRQPLFTAIVVGTLALGIGANTAIFGIVEALLVRPLPFPSPERLVTVATPMRGVGVGNAGLSYPELDDLRSRSGVFEDVTPVWAFDTNLTGGGRPERVAALAVSPNYFRMLDVRARMGRIFGPEDTAAGFAEGAILSDAAWRQRFGGDPRILGRRLRFDNDAYTIVGVLPPEFRHPGPAPTGDIEVWVTAGFRAAPFPDPPVRAARQLPRTIGRLKAGLTLAQAQSALDAFGGSLQKAFPNDYPERVGWSLRLTPLAEELTGDVKVLLLVILGAVACVLLTCCVSIANMMLAKATGRYREFAVRRALGALPRAIVRQVLTECVVLSGVGGAIGLALVLPLQRVLLTLAPVNLPRLTEVGLNTRMLLFVAVVSLVAGVFVGLVPARGIIGSDLTPHLKDGSQGSGRGRAAGRLRATLVACEIALSLTLMIGAGLLFKSFANVVSVDPGFDPNRLTVANLWLPAPNDPRTSPYPDQQTRNVFMREVLRRVRALPGVESAAMGGGQSIPLAGSNTATFRIEGRAVVRDGELPTAQATGVTPDFFKALGARQVAGRVFQENDDGPNRVVVIDDTMARKYWKGEDPIGRRIAFGQGGQPRWMEIVGVVGTMKTNAFEAPDTPHIYLCMYQGAGNAMSLFVRTVASAAVSGDQLRREIEAVDPNLPVFRVRPMADVISQSLARRRFALTLVGAFAATALLLAGLGIYGVTAYSVGQRSQEIGLRLAIGAGRRDILQLIVGQGLRVITAGIAVGLIGAALLTRLLTSLLFGATPTDPVTYVVVSSVLAVVALLACYVPATRALRIDPVVALRAE